MFAVFEQRKMRQFKVRHPKGDEHKAIGKGVKDVREWLEMTSEDEEGCVFERTKTAIDGKSK